jgi:hypothetical protein
MTAAEARYWETITLGTGNTSGVYDTRAEAVEAAEALEDKYGFKSAVVGFDAKGIAVERVR